MTVKLREVLNVLQRVADEYEINTPYIVGGIPRNVILNILNNLNDVDITTGSEDIHRLADLFAHQLGVEAKILKDGHKKVIYEGISIDFSSNFRYDNIDEILDSLGVANITDLKRETFSRDFTINTLLLPLDFSQIIDLTGKGVDDVRSKLIRCPVDCALAFTSSPIRMLRAFYYGAKYGLVIDDSVKNAVVEHLDLFKEIDRQYASEKINQIIKMKPEMIDEMVELGVLQHIPLTKELSDFLIRKKKLHKVLSSIQEEIVVYSGGEDPRKDPTKLMSRLPVFRKNYDLDEGWTKMTDEYRDGKNKGVKDFVDEKKKDPPRVKDIYEKSKKAVKKLAVIRMPNVRECPFGLPVALACRNAGNSVDQMEVLEDVPKEKREKYKAANRKVYRHHQSGQRCVYADKIVEDKEIVHCDYGEPGARIRDVPMRPAPYYPRVFNGLGQAGLYSWQVGDYTDYSDAVQMFDSLYFALYSSGGEVDIKKMSAIKNSEHYYDIEGSLDISEDE